MKNHFLEEDGNRANEQNGSRAFKLSLWGEMRLRFSFSLPIRGTLPRAQIESPAFQIRGAFTALGSHP